MEAGSYVLLSVGDECCLAVLGEDAEGQLCVTTRHIRVQIADLCWFVETGLHVDPLG
jgi:hypothetical protein